MDLRQILIEKQQKNIDINNTKAYDFMLNHYDSPNIIKMFFKHGNKIKNINDPSECPSVVLDHIGIKY